MATKIIHKKSSVASSIPAAGDLEPGEIAVNLADQKLYSKTTAGAVIELAPAGASSTSLTETCKNVSGGSLAIGTPVYQSGTAGNAMEVQKALSGNSGSMPAVGLLSSTLADEAEGTIVLSGFLQGLNTSAFSEGDTLYVSAIGALTTTIPTGEANLIQNIGKVIKVHASNGSIMVTGAGRANATPNLNDGNIFIGNASNQAVTTSLTTEVQTIGDARYVEVAGDTMTGDLSFGDNDKAIFGNGSDLQIYHDGSNSYVDAAGVGHLVLQSQGDDRDVKIKSDDGFGGLTDYITVDGSTGQVKLRYYGDNKLNTTSTGVDVTGTITSTGVDVTGTITSDGLTVEGDVTFGTSSEESFKFQGGSTNSTIEVRDNNRLRIKTGTEGSELNRLAIENNGDISLYEDTGTTAKFFWDASAESLGIGTSSPSEKLDVNGTAKATTFEVNGWTITESGGSLYFATGGTNKMKIDASGNLDVVGSVNSNATIT